MHSPISPPLPNDRVERIGGHDSESGRGAYAQQAVGFCDTGGHV
jgi:hypothetical protein